MQQSELVHSSEKILGLINETLEKVSFLAKGATCSVWQVQSDCRCYALRIIDADERVLDGAIDMFVRTELLANGGHVAEPILCSETVERILDGIRWSLDALVAGYHPERGQLSDQTCRDLGETLAVLHDLQTRDCGRPSHIDKSVIVGMKTDPMEGVEQRFENPLPEIWEAGYEHPVLRAVPEIGPDIMARLHEVSAVVKDRNEVLCHADLHERQLLCSSDGLAALIDFGDATILDRHWTLGSALYFHGADNFDKIYDSYIGASGAADNQRQIVSAFSVAIAMHHASRARLPGKHHRLERATTYIRDIMSG